MSLLNLPLEMHRLIFSCFSHCAEATLLIQCRAVHYFCRMDQRSKFCTVQIWATSEGIDHVFGLSMEYRRGTSIADYHYSRASLEMSL